MDGLAEIKTSFVERKAAQLSEERTQRGEVEPVIPTDPEPRTPEAEQESVDPDQDDPNTVEASDEQGELGEYPSDDLGDETPEDQDAEEPEIRADWETRYKDLQAEFSRSTANRGEMEQEHARSMQDHLSLRFDLEDRIGEADQRLQFSKSVMDGNASQFQNIDWSRVPPDKIQEVQAQAQNAFMMKQQADNAYSQFEEYKNETLDQVKQREAAIAKVRLKRSIPGWSNEIYASLREFATDQGMSQRSFNEITDPVIIEALYTASQTRKTGSIQKVVKRKGQAPRHKAARRTPRDERGKFAKATVEPNQRGSFADKHRHRLAMERGA